MAFKASRTSPNAGQAAAGPFWLRIAVICGLFTLLRAFDAQMAVSAAVRDFSHSAGLTDWARPGPYIMLVALAAFTIAIAGLFLFRFRTLHRSVPLAALTIIALALLAVAHSASLHVTQTVLQAPVGPLTVSRVIEAVLLLVLAILPSGTSATGKQFRPRSERIARTLSPAMVPGPLGCTIVACWSNLWRQW